MATVYRAYQALLEREVALKVLPEFLIEQPGFKARFHREVSRSRDCSTPTSLLAAALVLATITGQ